MAMSLYLRFLVTKGGVSSRPLPLPLAAEAGKWWKTQENWSSRDGAGLRVISWMVVSGV